MSSYYVLVDTYTDAMSVIDCLRNAGFIARVSPTPHKYHNLAGCGVAVMIEEKQVNDIKKCLIGHCIKYLKIVKYESAINPSRDRFC